MKDYFSISKKRILVTGASSGIGRQIAITLAELGAEVTLVGRNKERLEETFSSMAGKGHVTITADLTKKNDLNLLADQNAFDGVVLNAGIIEYVPIKFISEEKIKKIFDVNFSGTVLLCQFLLRNKLVNKRGSIIFISSISAMLGVTGTALYASSKAALNAFSKVVASEIAPQGIRSNSICPGIVITPLIEQAKNISLNNLTDEAKNYPLGYGSTQDVSNLVVFLLSDASKWMTGSNLIFDGGLTLT